MTELRKTAEKIWDWAVERDFRGRDPYDGLNSRILGPLTKHSRLLRLAAIQCVLKCPFDPGRILLIPPGMNPKGLALFLSALSFLPELDNEGYSDTLQQILLSLASAPDGSPAFSRDRSIRTDITVEDVNDSDISGWGYNFPWQGRAFYQPAWSPTAVCSSFVLDAFSDAASAYYPALACKLGEFVTDNLKIHEDDTGICFSYSPRDDSRVFNASLFAAKVLTRAIEHDPKNSERYRTLAMRACNYVVARQRPDGSWVYGEAEHWKWVDNLHTGFVLETLEFISRRLGTSKLQGAVVKGMDYYIKNLFEPDWTAKYYSGQKYPLDPHSYAQSAITFLELENHAASYRSNAEHVLLKAVEDLWDSERCGFIFRKYSRTSKRMIYLRWNQGWMFKAICRYLGEKP